MSYWEDRLYQNWDVLDLAMFGDDNFQLGVHIECGQENAFEVISEIEVQVNEIISKCTRSL